MPIQIQAKAISKTESDDAAGESAELLHNAKGSNYIFPGTRCYFGL
jgi:hypothetical protein